MKRRTFIASGAAAIVALLSVEPITPSAEWVGETLHLRGWWMFYENDGSEMGLSGVQLSPVSGNREDVGDICGYPLDELLAIGAQIDANEVKRLPARANYIIRTS